MVAPNKKPTMMEVKNVLSNLIIEYQNMMTAVRNLDGLLGAYINFKGDQKKFLDHLSKNKKEKSDVVLPNKGSKKTDKNLRKK